MRMRALLAAACLLGGATASPGASWPAFRGTPDLQGVAAGSLGTNIVKVWSAKIGTSVRSSPVVAGPLVFAGSDDGRITALRLADGTKEWECAVGAPVEASPLCHGTNVYVGTVDGGFVALDAASGELCWKAGAEGKITGSANAGVEGGTNVIVVGSYDMTMRGFDGATGREVWKFQAGNFINGGPAVAGGNVVFGGCDAMVRMLALVDGRELAAVNAGSYIPGSVAVAGGMAFAGSYGNRLICVDLAGGTVAWEYGDSDTGAFFSSPAVGAAVVVAGCRDKSVYCVGRKGGELVWRFEADSDVDASPVICDGKVVVCSTGGRLSILGLEDGRELASYDLGAQVSASPAVVAGTVIVADESGSVHLFSTLGVGGK